MTSTSTITNPRTGESTSYTWVSMNPVDIRRREAEASEVASTPTPSSLGQQTGTVVQTPYGGVSTNNPSAYEPPK